MNTKKKKAKEYRVKAARKDEDDKFGSKKFKKWLKEKGV
jgi:hypothetical protein